jgi:hypothetical protein
MEDRPVWKTVLSIALTLIGIIKLAVTCSQSSDRSSYSDNSYQSTNSLFDRYGSTRESKIDNEESNNLFYENYDSIKKLTDSERATYHVVKVKKDTLLPLDLTSKINIESKSFIQKNYDDSLKLAVKLPDNTSIFLHTYSSQADIMENFKSVKKSRDLGKINTEVDDKDSKILSYSYKYNGKNHNGCALVAKGDGLFTSIEFENSKMSKSEIYLVAFTYLAQLSK